MTDHSYEREHGFEGGHAELRLESGGFVFLCLPHGTGAFRIALPDGYEGDPWEWFGDQGHLGAHPWTAETRAARDKIEAFGYHLDLAEDGPNGWAAILFGGPNTTSMGWKVGRGQLRSEAAEAALEAVRAHEEDGADWPAVD